MKTAHSSPNTAARCKLHRTKVFTSAFGCAVKITEEAVPRNACT